MVIPAAVATYPDRVFATFGGQEACAQAFIDELQHAGVRFLAPPLFALLDVLAMDVGVVGIFSDWPATGTCSASCMGLR